MSDSFTFKSPEDRTLAIFALETLEERSRETARELRLSAVRNPDRDAIVALAERFEQRTATARRIAREMMGVIP